MRSRSKAFWALSQAMRTSRTTLFSRSRRFSARQQEAELRSQAAAENLRDLENNVVRDVRIAWLNAQNAFDRLRITAELLDNARQSYDLAQARYINKLSSIVEFNHCLL